MFARILCSGLVLLFAGMQMNASASQVREKKSPICFVGAFCDYGDEDLKVFKISTRETYGKFRAYSRSLDMPTVQDFLDSYDVAPCTIDDLQNDLSKRVALVSAAVRHKINQMEVINLDSRLWHRPTILKKNTIMGLFAELADGFKEVSMQMAPSDDFAIVKPRLFDVINTSILSITGKNIGTAVFEYAEGVKRGFSMSGGFLRSLMNYNPGVVVRPVVVEVQDTSAECAKVVRNLSEYFANMEVYIRDNVQVK